MLRKWIILSVIGMIAAGSYWVAAAENETADRKEVKSVEDPNPPRVVRPARPGGPQIRDDQGAETTARFPGRSMSDMQRDRYQQAIMQQQAVWVDLIVELEKIKAIAEGEEAVETVKAIDTLIQSKKEQVQKQRMEQEKRRLEMQKRIQERMQGRNRGPEARSRGRVDTPAEPESASPKPEQSAEDAAESTTD